MNAKERTNKIRYIAGDSARDSGDSIMNSIRGANNCRYIVEANIWASVGINVRNIIWSSVRNGFRQFPLKEL